MKNLNILLISIALTFNWLNAHANENTLTAVEPVVSPKVMNTLDPYEDFNRSVYRFNMGFHDLIGAPVTGVYLDYVPSPIQTGFSNFFSNLTVPLDMVNSLLQGKVEEGLSSFMRFTINSTFGLGGLLDIATSAGLPKKDEDFGQTLSVWGVWDEASYVMVPFLGPRTTRNLAGMIVDSSVDPIYEYTNAEDERNKIIFGSTVVNYAAAAPLIDSLRSQPDPYIFMRESYLQFRTNLIYDGNPPKANLDDFDFE